MPNGGVPMHMILYPKDGSSYILYYKGGEMRLYDRNVWIERRWMVRPFAPLQKPKGQQSPGS